MTSCANRSFNDGGLSSAMNRSATNRNFWKLLMLYFLNRDGNFAVKRSVGKFNRVPSDQCIEQTINRQQKCSGGITGFSRRDRATLGTY